MISVNRFCNQEETDEGGKKAAKVEEEKSQKTVKEEWAVLDNDTVYIAGTQTGLDIVFFYIRWLLSSLLPHIE
mgnify:CR=1 FL=1